MISAVILRIIISAAVIVIVKGAHGGLCLMQRQAALCTEKRIGRVLMSAAHTADIAVFVVFGGGSLLLGYRFPGVACIMEGGVYTAPLLLIALSMIRSTAFGAHDYIIALLKDIAAGYTA